MDSADFERLLHAVAAKPKEEPVSSFEQKAINHILNDIDSTVGTVDRNNNQTDADISKLLGRIGHNTQQTGTITQSDLDITRQLLNTQQIVREDENEVNMQKLLQQVATTQVKPENEELTKKVMTSYADKRTKDISNMFKQKKKCEQIDMAFLLDGTGSMGRFLVEVKEKVKYIVNQIKNKHNDANIRFALVTYHGRDQGNDVIDFTNRESEFINKLQSVKARGGSSGGAEDVYGGMKKVAGLDWKYVNRLLHHIGDMPTNGRKYSRGSPCDIYPETDPDIKSIFDDWTGKVIRYTFFKITDYTDVMMEEFSKIAPADFDFNVKELKDVSHLADVVRFTATNTVNTTTANHLQPSRSVSVSHIKTGQEEKTRQQKAAIEKFVPFSGTCRIQMMNFLPTREQLLSCATEEFPPSWLYEVQETQLKNQVQVNKVQGVGVNRLCLECVVEDECAQLECGRKDTIVIKEYLVNKYGEADFEDRKKDYSHQTVSSAIAHTLAEEFMQSMDSNQYDAKIKFIPAGIIQIATMKNGVVDRSKLWNCEKMLKSEFQKFTNNVGDIFDDTAKIGADEKLFNQLLEFSMFTHKFTKGTMMVVDLQGEYDEASKTFTLTDPVILCENVKIFGNTNMGEQGIEKCRSSYRHYLDAKVDNGDFERRMKLLNMA